MDTTPNRLHASARPLVRAHTGLARNGSAGRAEPQGNCGGGAGAGLGWRYREGSAENFARHFGLQNHCPSPSWTSSCFVVGFTVIPQTGSVCVTGSSRCARRPTRGIDRRSPILARRTRGRHEWRIGDLPARPRARRSPRGRPRRPSCRRTDRSDRGRRPARERGPRAPRVRPMKRMPSGRPTAQAPSSPQRPDRFWGDRVCGC